MYKAALGIAVVCFLAGCQHSTAPEAGEAETPLLQVENQPDGTNEELSDQDTAKHLADVASRVTNVSDATAIVIGNTAVVGIDVDKDLDQSRVGTIKYSVAEALHHDAYGKNAVVVADADGMQRLRDLASRIRQGEPAAGISEELSEVVGRYMPLVPNSTDIPEESNENKRVLSKEEQQELEDLQQQQTGNH